MKKSYFVAVCVCASLSCLLAVEAAPAQYGGYSPYTQPTTSPYARPPISPYLQLLRSGGTPAGNFYQGYQAQVGFSSALQNQQRQITANQASLLGLQQGQGSLLDFISTGHQVRFLNYQQYYLNLSPQHGAAFGHSASGLTGGSALGLASGTGSSRFGQTGVPGGPPVKPGGGSQKR